MLTSDLESSQDDLCSVASGQIEDWYESSSSGFGGFLKEPDKDSEVLGLSALRLNVRTASFCGINDNKPFPLRTRTRKSSVYVEEMKSRFHTAAEPVPVVEVSLEIVRPKYTLSADGPPSADPFILGKLLNNALLSHGEDRLLLRRGPSLIQSKPVFGVDHFTADPEPRRGEYLGFLFSLEKTEGNSNVILQQILGMKADIALSTVGLVTVSVTTESEAVLANYVQAKVITVYSRHQYKLADKFLRGRTPLRPSKNWIAVCCQSTHCAPVEQKLLLTGALNLSTKDCAKPAKMRCSFYPRPRCSLPVLIEFMGVGTQSSASYSSESLLSDSDGMNGSPPWSDQMLEPKATRSVYQKATSIITTAFQSSVVAATPNNGDGAIDEAWTSWALRRGISQTVGFYVATGELPGLEKMVFVIREEGGFAGARFKGWGIEGAQWEFLEEQDGLAGASDGWVIPLTAECYIHWIKLQRQMVNPVGGVREDDLKEIAAMMILTVSGLHDLRVAVRDLNPNNISMAYIKRHKRFVPRIRSLSRASYFSDGKSIWDVQLREAIRGDWQSLGHFLYFLAVGGDVVKRPVGSHIPKDISFSNQWSSFLITIFAEAADSMDGVDILYHPWVASVNWQRIIAGQI